MQLFRKSLLVAAAFIGGAVSLVPTSGCTTEAPCVANGFCPAYGGAWRCPHGGSYTDHCLTEASAQVQCDAANGGVVLWVNECDPPSTEEPDWDPENHISWNARAGQYEIDEDFWDDVVLNYTELLDSDGTKLVPENPYSDYYKIDNVTSGCIADLLGLEDDDVLKKLNDEDLDGEGNIFMAFGDLQGETTFRLEFTRNSSTETNTYVVQ